MDTHLIGIDLAQLLLKQNARTEKGRQTKASASAAEPLISAKGARSESC